MKLANQERAGQMGSSGIYLPINCLTAVIGPNGAGKSTLLQSFIEKPPKTTRKLFQIEPPCQFEGIDFTVLSQKEKAKVVGYLPQTPTYDPLLTVKEVVGLGRYPHTFLGYGLQAEDKAMIKTALQLTRLSLIKNRQMGSLSGGERQRVFLALLIAQNTPYLLLDEATTFLDPHAYYEWQALLTTLKKRGKTIVSVTHNLFEVYHQADYLLALRKGEVLSHGVPKNILTPQLIEELFQLPYEYYKKNMGDIYAH